MENKLNLVIAKLSEIKTDYFEDTLKKWNEIQESVKKFDSTNLKLHHGSYYLYQMVQDGILTDKQSNILFQDICEMELKWFEEWESENVPSIQREYIGRTSSFYYKPKTWSETVFGYSTISDLLEGKNIPLVEIFGDIDQDLYSYFFEKDFHLERYAMELIESVHNQLEEDHTIEEFESELEELLLDEQLLLEDIENELKELMEYVQECRKAYDYLKSYKTEEHEINNFKHYLEFELENYVAEKQAENFYYEMIEQITPLNKVEYIRLGTQLQEGEFIIQVFTNLGNFNIETNIKHGNEFSAKLVGMITFNMFEMIDKQFKF